MSTLFPEDYEISPDAPADPDYLPDNAYNFILTGVKFGKSKDKVAEDGTPKQGVLFSYTVQGGDYHGFVLTEWLSAHPLDDIRTQGRLKARLISLGVPEDKVNSARIEDLIGKGGRIQVVNNGHHRNIRSLELDGASNSAGAKSGGSAFGL
jgi:hypothetical protein